jgi:hypothetical protein
MLEAAKRVGGVEPPGKSPLLAAQFREVLRGRSGAEPRLRALLAALDDPAPWSRSAARCPDLAALSVRLPADNHSCIGWLRPGLALAYQAQVGSELSLDLIFDRRHRRAFPLLTRGIGGGVFSDLGLYLAFSPRFLVVPCFHTHPEPRNELGCEMPSLADFLVLEGWHRQLGEAPTADRVYFPSGRHTVYWVDRQGAWHYRQLGDTGQRIERSDWLGSGG